jgi:SAM-dependent methyltransferase
MGLVERLKSVATNWVDLETALLREALHDVAPRARGRLLDVGCGEKPYEEILRPYVESYVGVEHRGTFAETAAYTGTKKPDAYYDGTRLPFDDESFETVVSFQVLEHTPDPEGLLHEMTRVLVKGGLAIVTAPFSFRLHEEPHDYFRFTPYGLRVLSERVGLEVEEIRARGSLWSLLGHKLNTFLAFDVASARGAAMEMGASRQERQATAKVRLWTLPFVAPAMLGVGGAARLLDRAASVPGETLGYVLLARKS